LRLVRDDVPGGFRSIARNKKRIEQRKVGEYYDHHRKQETDCRDFCSGSLCGVDGVGCHFIGWTVATAR
jgi:hypothetical protein